MAKKSQNYDYTAGGNTHGLKGDDWDEEKLEKAFKEKYGKELVGRVWEKAKKDTTLSKTWLAWGQSDTDRTENMVKGPRVIQIDRNLSLEGAVDAMANELANDSSFGEERDTAIDEIIQEKSKDIGAALALQVRRDRALKEAVGKIEMGKEIVLAGASIVNEGVDWVITIEDISKGNYSSALALLPFVSAQALKTGGKLIFKSGDKVVDASHMGRDEITDALKKYGSDKNPLFNEGKRSTNFMDEKEFSKIKEAFTKQGGVIDQSADGKLYLQKQGANASTFNAKTVVMQDNPTRSEVFEELIHTAQWSAGRATGENAREMEIEAAQKLLRNQSAYELSAEEVQMIQKRLELLNSSSE